MNKMHMFIVAITAFLLLDGYALAADRVTVSNEHSLGHFAVLAAQNVRNLRYDIDAASDTGNAVQTTLCFETKGYPLFATSTFNSIGTTDHLAALVRQAIESGRKQGIDGDILVGAQLDIQDQPNMKAEHCVTINAILVKLTKGAK